MTTTTTTLNELTDAFIDGFIAKFKEEITLKPSISRSPTASAEKSSENPSSSISGQKIDIKNLPWTIETVFY